MAQPLKLLHLEASILRDGPFNFQGVGGYGFFLKKYFDSQCCWKKYSDFGGGKKKKFDSEFLSYNLMLNSATKKKILTLVMSEKKILNEKKTYPPPPCKLNGRSLTISVTPLM